MGEEHRINEIKGVIISRALLKEYGYDGDMPTDKQMQVIGNGLLEYWGVSDGFKEALASTMENMFGVKAKDKVYGNERTYYPPAWCYSPRHLRRGCIERQVAANI